jgi:RNA polymerase sigma factor (sigma-70 family)
VTITQEQFDSLLTWLGNDRDEAGRKYETIRSGLVRIFVARGFNDAEDLADETINRVMVRLPCIRSSYKGNPACYFYGVARNVIRESIRRKEIAGGLVDGSVEPELEPSEEYACLGHCLNRLPANKRDLVLDYYLYEGHKKIEHHKQMAGQLKISEGAIRNRVYQIKVKLENCMRQCALRKKGMRSAPCLSTSRSCAKRTTPRPKDRERYVVASFQ